jgi:hypothetical protein
LYPDRTGRRKSRQGSDAPIPPAPRWQDSSSIQGQLNEWGLVLFVSFANWTAQTVFTHDFVALVHCGSRFVHDQAPLSFRRSTPEMLVPLKCVLGVLILGSVLSVADISFALHRAILVSVGWSNSSFYSAALHVPRCHQFCFKRLIATGDSAPAPKIDPTNGCAS